MDLPANTGAQAEEGVLGYAQAFRVIGSVIETLKVESFDLEVKDDEYWMRGCAKEAAPTSPALREKANFLGSWLRIRKRFFSQQFGAAFEFHYTQAELRDLELKGRSLRGTSEAYPDAQSLSETLRCVGEFLDAKHVCLSRLSMRGRWITLHYKSAQGHLVVEEHTATSLYSFWASLCARRTNSDKASPRSKGPKHFRIDTNEQVTD